MMQDVLEWFKKRGFYSVQLYYGEGVGCDDSSVAQMERRIRLFAQPVGVLGECMCAFSGKLGEFLTFDFSQFPIEIPNDNVEARMAAMEKGGWYCWGTSSAIEYLKKEVWPKLQGIGIEAR